MSEELPEEYQPKILRGEKKKPRKRAHYQYAVRHTDNYLSYIGANKPRANYNPMKLLEHVPEEQDFNKGMPVIVKVNIDGSEEVLYVWHIHYQKWVRERENR
jgi:hypothetical protein